jgi:hypothetical protein
MTYFMRDLLVIIRDFRNLIDNAKFNFRNGVEHNGVDEGEIRGTEFLADLSKRIDDILSRVCKTCDGDGYVLECTGVDYVTADMASDACEPAMEGMPMEHIDWVVCPDCIGGRLADEKEDK